MPNDPQLKQASDANDASKMDSIVLANELRSRDYVVIPPAHLDRASGLLVQDGEYFDPDTGEPVDGQEAYRRASGGY